MFSRVPTVLSVACWFIVHRRDVDGQRIGALIEIDPAVGSAAIVTYLEGEVGVTGTVGIGHRRKFELTGIQVGLADKISGTDRTKVIGVAESAEPRQGCDLHGQQGIGRGVVSGIGKAKVRCS